MGLAFHAVPRLRAPVSSKIEPQLLRRLTVRRVLELLQEHGPCSRADLTRQAKMSAPTISKAVDSLLESGLVEEGDARPMSKGRPARILRLATEKIQVIGIVIDADRCELITAAIDGSIDESRRISIPTPQSYPDLIDTIDQLVSRLLRLDVATVSIGISMPGLIRGRAGVSVFSPNLHLTDGQQPAQVLQDRLGINCTLIQENQALSLAERMYHPNESLDNFVMLDVSTGLGVGVFTGGRLLEGHSGLAGELGHLTINPHGRLCGCGNRGCLETVACDRALVNLISERLGRPIDIDEVTLLIQTGELVADVELQQTCESLAIAIAAAINIFNPKTVLIHGKIFDIRDGLFELTTQLAHRRTLSPPLDECSIQRARCSKLQGAVATAIYSLTHALGPTLD